MNWQLAIERNREALQRIVTALFVMAGLAENASIATLPRHLRNHVLRILRPAESAVRRLIVMTARGMESASAPLSPGGRESLFPHLRGRSTSKCLEKAREGVRSGRQSRLPSIPLFDPLKSFDAGKKYSKSFPRISFIGVTDPCPLPPVLTPDDPINSERLSRRLQALRRALDDLDGQANRYARWKTRQDLASRSMQDGFTPAGATGQRLAAYERKNQLKDVRQRYGRLTPFRPGWPPGYRKRPTHPVDDVLADCHSLALMAINPPDT